MDLRSNDAGKQCIVCITSEHPAPTSFLSVRARSVQPFSLSHARRSGTICFRCILLHELVQEVSFPLLLGKAPSLSASLAHSRCLALALASLSLSLSVALSLSRSLSVCLCLRLRLRVSVSACLAACLPVSGSLSLSVWLCLSPNPNRAKRRTTACGRDRLLCTVNSAQATSSRSLQGLTHRPPSQYT